MAPFHARWQIEWTETRTHQATHGASCRRKQTPDQPVAALSHPHPIPAIGAFPTLRLEDLEVRRPVVELHAGAQLVQLLRAQLADDPDRVVAARLEARMRQTVRDLTRIGEDEQTAGVEIQAAHGEPPAPFHDRHAVEDARAPLGVAP